MLELIIRLTACLSAVMGVVPTYSIKLTFEDLPPRHLAETGVDLDYFQAEIAFDTLEIDKMPLRPIIVHELGHILLWELGVLAEAQDEPRALRLQEQLLTLIQRWYMWNAVCRRADRGSGDGADEHEDLHDQE